MSHVPSHWDSLVDLLQRFNYSADLPRCGIASCRSSPTTMGNSLDKASFFICTDLLYPFLVFFFHFSFLNSPPLMHEHRQRLNCLFFGPRLTEFIENSLAKSGIFSGISLAYLSTPLKNRPDENL